MSCPARTPSLKEENQISNSHHESAPERSRTPGLDDDDKGEIFSDEEHGQSRVEELRETLRKLKDERKSKFGFVLASPFAKRLKESPLPKFYKINNSLKFNGISDPIEYLIRFNIEMEAYRVEEPTLQVVSCYLYRERPPMV